MARSAHSAHSVPAPAQDCDGASGPAAQTAGCNTDPRFPYDGPAFDEYCIREKAYLPAARDRSPCITCPLGNLCDAGFKEQVRLVANGENPSLTDCKIIPEEDLTRDSLLSGLSPEQQHFVLRHVYGEREEQQHGTQRKARRAKRRSRA
jgi:hypothetical protein